VTLTRKVGFGVIAAGAVAAFFLLAPPSIEVTEAYQPPLFAAEPSSFASDAYENRGYRELVLAALDDAEANESRADSAPQQQVVNGWVARDLLAVLGLAADDTVLTNTVIAENTQIIAISNTEMLLALAALSDQQAAIAKNTTHDQRVPAMLALGLVALAWWAVTEPTLRPAIDAPGAVPNDDAPSPRQGEV